jgi:mannose-6-phosphate isomerase-like protein (cupin superfamily)
MCMTGESHPSRDAKAAPGLTFYTGASQGHVSQMMSAPELPPGIVLDGLDPTALAGGTVDDIVYLDSRPGGFSLANIRLAPDYILPSHHHDVDCLYYVQAGSIILGRRQIGAGGGFVVLAGRAYGYRAGQQGATVLEFRNATNFNMVITETSAAKWREIAQVAEQHDGWPGFAESVALPRE